MEESLARLQETVGELVQQLRELNQRISALEARAEGVRPEGEPVRPAVRAYSTAETSADAASLLGLVGRSCLVLGGAYLLRAVTDSGVLPRGVGTGLGLAYGLAWLAMAWRAAAVPTPGAGFHAVTSSLIVVPLLWEATARFHLLSQPLAAAAMTALSLAGLVVARSRARQSIAWIVTTTGIVGALVFMASGTAAPFATYLAILGVCTLWLGYTVDWTWLRWPVAAVADLTVVVMVLSATETWRHDEAGAVMLVQVVLFSGYLISFAARTLYRSREVVPFEIFQTAALLVVGFGGAVYLMVTTGSSAAILGIVSIVFGVGSYAVAVAFIDWRGGHRRNFVFYASLGAVFVIAGTAITLDASLQAVLWAALAIVSAWAGRRYATITLSSHATVYVVAGAIVSGLLAHALDGFTASTAVRWATLSMPAGAVLLAAAASAATPQACTNESWGNCSRVPKVTLVVLLLWTAGGALCGLLVPLVAGSPGLACDAALAATIRTLVLGGSVVLLALASRSVFREGRWLMYVVLVAVTAKLLVEDFPNGRPSTLFLTFAVYGAALILGPRLSTRPRAAALGPTSPPPVASA